MQRADTAIRKLSSGTIGSLTGLNEYRAIDCAREKVAGEVGRMIDRGELPEDCSWIQAWNHYVDMCRSEGAVA